MNELQQAVKIGKRLQQLAKKVDFKERKKIYRKAARPLIKQARQNAPEDEGVLRKSIKVLPIAKTQDAVYVGPRVSGRSKKKQPFYAHIIEYGKKGYEGVRYMSKAYDSKRAEVLKRVADGLRDSYNKAIRSVANR